MQLQTPLNWVKKFKESVYDNATWSQYRKFPGVHVRPRKNSSPTCSECRRKGAMYDHLQSVRRLEFVPLWQGEIDNE